MSKTEQDIVLTWDHMHKYSPAPRHRRRQILKILKNLQFKNCLDVGCAQGYLLQEIDKKYKAKCYGCDICPDMINHNKRILSQFNFFVADIEKEIADPEQKFDLVICSEVVEHLWDWKRAIKNLTSICNRYLVITVPGGKLRTIDQKIGHYRHYAGSELKSEIEKCGFQCQSIERKGFPIHSLYKRVINQVNPDKIYAAFSGEKKYSLFKILFCQLLFYMFYLDELFQTGEQIYILAEKKNAMESLT